jgi:hypothetical protein
MQVAWLLCDQTGSRKSKMAASKPEVLISACRWNMNEIPLATPCFGVQQLNASSQNAVRPNRKSEIQPSSRHLGFPTSGLYRTSFILFHWVVGPLKHGCSRWNFDSVSSISLDISTSGLGPPSWILGFRSGGTAFSLLPLSCRTPKTWGSLWNFDSMMFICNNFTQFSIWVPGTHGYRLRINIAADTSYGQHKYSVIVVGLRQLWLNE